MKKLLSLTLVVMLVLTSLVMPVSAAPSPELDDIISSMEGTQPDKTKVTVDLTKLPEADQTLVPKFDKDTVIAQRGVIIPADTEYPLNITAKVDGVKTTSFLYVLAKAADHSVVRLNIAVEEDGVIGFNIDKPYVAFSFINAAKVAVEDAAEEATVNKDELDHAIEITHKEEPVVVYAEKPAALKIPASSIQKIVEYDMSLTVKSDIAGATFDTKSLDAVLNNAEKLEQNTYIVIHINESEHEDLSSDQRTTIQKLNPALVLTAEVSVNGKIVPDFKGGKVAVAIPFTAEAGTTLADYVLVHVRDNGSVARIATKTGINKIYADFEHFSEYAIVNNADLNKVENEINDNVQTGEDLTGVMIAAAVLLIALAMIVILILFKKKNKKEENA